MVKGLLGPDFKLCGTMSVVCFSAGIAGALLRGIYAPNTALILQISAYFRVSAQQLV